MNAVIEGKDNLLEQLGGWRREITQIHILWRCLWGSTELGRLGIFGVGGLVKLFFRCFFFFFSQTFQGFRVIRGLFSSGLFMVFFFGVSRFSLRSSGWVDECREEQFYETVLFSTSFGSGMSWSM
jgi:hypothetical protein